MKEFSAQSILRKMRVSLFGSPQSLAPSKTSPQSAVGGPFLDGKQERLKLIWDCETQASGDVGEAVRAYVASPETLRWQEAPAEFADPRQPILSWQTHGCCRGFMVAIAIYLAFGAFTFVLWHAFAHFFRVVPHSPLSWK